MITLDCGHVATPDGIATGYATAPDGQTLCYLCADAAQLEDMRTADRFFAYMSSDGSAITTWSGGHLGRIVRVTRNGRQTFVRVIDSHGKPWAGIGPAESGTYVSLRRVKS